MLIPRSGHDQALKFEGNERVGVYRAKMPDPNNPDQTVFGRRSLGNHHPAWGERLAAAASVADTPGPGRGLEVD